MLQAQEMKRTKHHNKRRLPAAMLIQCLWRMEVGRRDDKKELEKIKANGKSTYDASSGENGVTPNGRVYTVEEDRAKTMLGAMYSLRRLKYLACRSHKDCKKRKLFNHFSGRFSRQQWGHMTWEMWLKHSERDRQESNVNIKSTSKYKFIHSLYAEISEILILY